MRRRRIVAVSDFHSGHAFGLTPPDYQGGDAEESQAIAWKAYAATLKALRPR